MPGTLIGAVRPWPRGFTRGCGTGVRCEAASPLGWSPGGPGEQHPPGGLRALSPRASRGAGGRVGAPQSRPTRLAPQGGASAPQTCERQIRVARGAELRPAVVPSGPARDLVQPFDKGPWDEKVSWLAAVPGGCGDVCAPVTTQPGTGITSDRVVGAVFVPCCTFQPFLLSAFKSRSFEVGRGCGLGKGPAP